MDISPVAHKLPEMEINVFRLYGAFPRITKERIWPDNFTLKKTNHVFPCVGIAQAHEQNNRPVKVDGGAIDIIDN